MNDEQPSVSRAAAKLDHALACFGIDPAGWTCADLGSNTGGFVDCLLRRAAARVYAVERGYGVLNVRLRNDTRVVVLERTDALQVRLPEPVRLVTIDVGWTRQRHILPPAARMLAPGGEIVSLVKPHYEAPAGQLDRGVLKAEHVESVLAAVRRNVAKTGLVVVAETESPILGGGGNREFLWRLREG